MEGMVLIIPGLWPPLSAEEVVEVEIDVEDEEAAVFFFFFACTVGGGKLAVVAAICGTVAVVAVLVGSTLPL